LALTVEQIGYCDRISESAVQYAVRLLSTKPELGARAEGIAQELVYGYKDHGFVIDIEEAKIHLGDEWIKTGTPEMAAAEIIYSHFELVNFYLGLANYQLGRMIQDKAKLAEAAKFSDQAAAIKGPYQETAYKNSMLIKKEAGISTVPVQKKK